MASPRTQQQQEQAKRINALIEKVGGAAKLARLAKISQATITKLLSGERNLGATVARKLAKGTGVGIDSLLADGSPREESMGSMRASVPYSAVTETSLQVAESSPQRHGGHGRHGVDTGGGASRGGDDRVKAMRLARQRGATAEDVAELLDAEPPAERAGDAWWWFERVLEMTDKRPRAK